MIHLSFAIKDFALKLTIIQTLNINQFFIIFAYYQYYGYATVQYSLNAEMLHGQQTCLHLVLIMGIRQIAPLTYL